MREPLFAKCMFPERRKGRLLHACKHHVQMVFRPEIRDDGALANTCHFCGGPLRRLSEKERERMRKEKFRKAEGGG